MLGLQLQVKIIRFRLDYGEYADTGWDGRNQSRQIKILGENGDRENNYFPCPHKQDWQPHTVDAQSA